MGGQGGQTRREPAGTGRGMGTPAERGAEIRKRRAWERARSCVRYQREPRRLKSAPHASRSSGRDDVHALAAARSEPEVKSAAAHSSVGSPDVVCTMC